MRSRELALMATSAGGMVCGVDEAGRGPLAGPVVAACCYVPADVYIAGIADSKKLDEAAREALYATLTSHPRVRWAVHVNPHTRIDEINILQATLESMRLSVEDVSKQVAPTSIARVLIDGNRMPKGLEVPADTIVKGDATVHCIAAASILAKVTRDRLMLELHAQYPQYNFAAHKGYGVPEHMALIHKFGPSPVHRRTFAPVKHMLPQPAPVPMATAAPVKTPRSKAPLKSKPTKK